MAKILIIDGSNDVLSLYTMLLTKRGYEVQTADYKNQLLSRFGLKIPDLILLDVRSNGVDGRELCKELNSRNFDKKIPIILLCGDQKLLIHYEECKAVEILQKPFRLETLIEAVVKIIGE